MGGMDLIDLVDLIDFAVNEVNKVSKVNGVNRVPKRESTARSGIPLNRRGGGRIIRASVGDGPPVGRGRARVGLWKD